MDNDALILEKITNLTLSMNNDFFALTKKIDDHIKKTEIELNKQEDFNKSISEKFHFFKGASVMTFIFISAFISLLVYIYSNDRGISNETDKSIISQVKTITDDIILLKYQKNK